MLLCSFPFYPHGRLHLWGAWTRPLNRFESPGLTPASQVSCCSGSQEGPESTAVIPNSDTSNKHLQPWGSGLQISDSDAEDGPVLQCSLSSLQRLYLKHSAVEMACGKDPQLCHLRNIIRKGEFAVAVLLDHLGEMD